MKRWRTITILTLLILPIVLFAALGAWALYELGWAGWWWLSLPVAWGVAFLLAKMWRSPLLPLPPPDFEPALHWTPLDERAWQIVEAKANAVANIPPEQMAELQHYIDTAQELSGEIARCYHPKAKNPIGSLTITEILAAAQLALEDLADLYDRYVPAGHVITVDQWKSLSKLPKRYRTVSNLGWAASAVLAPVAVLGRYAIWQSVFPNIGRAIKSNLLTWFYKSFVHRVGFYAIEMNSGRLKGGAERFREAFERMDQAAARPAMSGIFGPRLRKKQKKKQTPTEPGAAAAPSAPDDGRKVEVTVCLVGQVKAGKSSLINSLLGGQHAEVDVLPLTSEVKRYRLDLPDSSDRLVLLDTPGYGVYGMSARQLRDTQTALKQSDLALLLMDVTSPGRAPDAKLQRELAEWFESQPKLKPPPMIGVLTHIDLLRPVMEWSPPYDWQNPALPKEQAIGEAVDYNREQLGSHLTEIVPVCTDFERERTYGIEEWLLPVMAAALDHARATSLVRTLHAEIDRNRLGQLVEQFRNLGRALRGV